MRQVRRLERFARSQGWKDDEIVVEIGSGLNGKRKKLLRVLRDLSIGHIIGEVADDLAWDLIEILTSACGRWYGRRAARNRARRAIEAMGCK